MALADAADDRYEHAAVSAVAGGGGSSPLSMPWLDDDTQVEDEVHADSDVEVERVDDAKAVGDAGVRAASRVAGDRAVGASRTVADPITAHSPREDAVDASPCASQGAAGAGRVRADSGVAVPVHALLSSPSATQMPRPQRRGRLRRQVVETSCDIVEERTAVPVSRAHVPPSDAHVAMAGSGAPARPHSEAPRAPRGRGRGRGARAAGTAAANAARSRYLALDASLDDRTDDSGESSSGSGVDVEGEDGVIRRVRGRRAGHGLERFADSAPSPGALIRDSAEDAYDLNDSFINDGEVLEETTSDEEGEDTSRGNASVRSGDGGDPDAKAARKRKRIRPEDLAVAQPYHTRSLMFSQPPLPSTAEEWDRVTRARRDAGASTDGNIGAVGAAEPAVAGPQTRPLRAQLGRIAARGRDMPLVTALLEAQAAGRLYDDMTDSEVGSSLDDDSDDPALTPTRPRHRHRDDDDDDDAAGEPRNRAVDMDMPMSQLFAPPGARRRDGRGPQDTPSGPASPVTGAASNARRFAVSGAVHAGVHCAACKADPIVGDRWTCDPCRRVYNLCGTCALNRGQLHSEHEMRHMAAPASSGVRGHGTSASGSRAPPRNGAVPLAYGTNATSAFEGHSTRVVPSARQSSGPAGNVLAITLHQPNAATAAARSRAAPRVKPQSASGDVMYSLLSSRGTQHIRRDVVKPPQPPPLPPAVSARASATANRVAAPPHPQQEKDRAAWAAAAEERRRHAAEKLAARGRATATAVTSAAAPADASVTRAPLSREARIANPEASTTDAVSVDAIARGARQQTPSLAAAAAARYPPPHRSVVGTAVVSTVAPQDAAVPIANPRHVEVAMGASDDVVTAWESSSSASAAVVGAAAKTAATRHVRPALHLGLAPLPVVPSGGLAPPPLRAAPTVTATPTAAVLAPGSDTRHTSAPAVRPHDAGVSGSSVARARVDDSGLSEHPVSAGRQREDAHATVMAHAASSAAARTDAVVPPSAPPVPTVVAARRTLLMRVPGMTADFADALLQWVGSGSMAKLLELSPVDAAALVGAPVAGSSLQVVPVLQGVQQRIASTVAKRP